MALLCNWVWTRLPVVVVDLYIPFFYNRKVVYFSICRSSNTVAERKDGYVYLRFRAAEYSLNIQSGQMIIARKSGRRKNNAGTDKRKINWLSLWLRRNCMLKDALEQGSSTRGPPVSFLWPEKAISQNTRRYEYWSLNHYTPWAARQVT